MNTGQGAFFFYAVFAVRYSNELFIEEHHVKDALKMADEILTESSKSPASIAKSNKQWVGLACIRRGTSPS